MPHNLNDPSPDWLARLHARAFRGQRPWSADEFRNLLDSPHVFLSAHPHGFALGRVIADEAELLTLAVDPELRRQGTGRACLTGFCDTARARAATTAFLEVAADNAAAIALYKTAGFALTAIRRAYYKRQNAPDVDALVMTLSLAQPAQTLRPR